MQHLDKHSLISCNWVCFVFFCGVSQLVHEDNCIKISSEGLSLVINSLFSSVFPDMLLILTSPTLAELLRLPVLDLGSDPAHVLGAVLACLSFPAGKDSWIASFLSLCGFFYTDSVGLGGAFLV